MNIIRKARLITCKAMVDKAERYMCKGDLDSTVKAIRLFNWSFKIAPADLVSDFIKSHNSTVYTNAVDDVYDFMNEYNK